MTRSSLISALLTGVLLFALAGCGNDAPISPPPEPPPTPGPGPTPEPPPGQTPGPLPGLPILGPTPGGSDVSGTVTAPASGDVTGTIVVACLDLDCDSEALTTQTDASGAYTLADVPAGQYGLIAWKDVDNDQSVSNGDYIGVYSVDSQNPTLVTPPATGVDITMIVYNDGTSPPQEPVPGDGSISGTVFAPAGGTIVGTTGVIACYLTDDPESPCDLTLSGVVELRQPGTTVSYNVTGLQAGQYLMVAVADADGNGSFEDPTDFVGIHPSVQAPELVSPPATGVDIPMVLNSELQGAALDGAALAGAALKTATGQLVQQRQVQRQFLRGFSGFGR